MSLSGQVQNGVVVLDGGVCLPEGTKVQVEPVIEPSPPARLGGPDWDAALQAAGELEKYDLDAWRERARHHLP